MRLIISTPTAVVEDVADVRHIRAEDPTGAFGIEPGHTEFVAVLRVSVVTWRDATGQEGFVLVRRGVLTVSGGDLVQIAARGAIREKALKTLDETALEQMRRADEDEETSRSSDARLHIAMMRQVERVLNAGRSARVSPSSLSLHGEASLETDAGADR